MQPIQLICEKLFVKGLRAIKVHVDARGDFAFKKKNYNSRYCVNKEVKLTLVKQKKIHKREGVYA